MAPDYAPQTVNTDGWWATRNAFGVLFPTIATILCFLHEFLKIRERCRKARELHQRVWDVYRAATVGEFRERMAALRAWCEQGAWSKAVREVVAKLCKRESEYAVSNTRAPPTDSIKGNTTPIGYTTFRSVHLWPAPGRPHGKR